jgi:hypothetical protein
VKKHVERHLERYKDRPSPSFWLSAINDMANSDSEVEDEHEWRDILEECMCSWCGCELGPSDQFCWSRDCPASPIFLHPAPKGAGMGGAPGEGEDTSVKPVEGIARRRLYKIRSVPDGRWAGRGEYPELRFLAHRPARAVDHAFYNAHALVRVIDLSKRKRKQPHPLTQPPTPLALAAPTPAEPTELVSQDPVRYRWQVSK